MDRARGELFTGAGLPRDEHGSWSGSGTADQRLHVLHRRAFSDEIVERALRANVTLKQIHLSRELPPVGSGANAHQQLVPENRLCTKNTPPSRIASNPRSIGAKPGLVIKT